MEDYRYLFGPVPSRRFGRSLGVDLNPFKTCSLDCVFCHLGQTTEKTIEQREYVPIEAVLAELDKWLKTEGKADYITLAGSGEPTLHSRFGEVLHFIRQNSTRCAGPGGGRRVAFDVPLDHPSPGAATRDLAYVDTFVGSHFASQGRGLDRTSRDPHRLSRLHPIPGGACHQP